MYRAEPEEVDEAVWEQARLGGMRSLVVAVAEEVEVGGLGCSVSEDSAVLPISGLVLSSNSSSELRAHPGTTRPSLVRRTGLPYLPLPSLVGLPGIPSGSLRLTSPGRLNVQFAHVSSLDSKLPLYRLYDSVLLLVEKYG